MWMGPPGGKAGVRLSAKHLVLEIDEQNGALSSVRDKREPGREMLASGHESLPLFTIQYLDEERRFRQVSSDQAQSCGVERRDEGEVACALIHYEDIGGLGLDAEVRIRCPRDGQLTYWSLSLTQSSPVNVTDVQFPFVVVPYRYDDGGPTNLLVPLREGQLFRHPQPEQLEPDHPGAWQFVDDEQHFLHYPGSTFAQFLAYYDDNLGIYLGCHDPDGQTKNIKPVHHRNGIRLGMSHVVGWSGTGRRDLGYEVALGVYSGDWYVAADIYKDWYETTIQTTPLHRREDIPLWLLDSPLHVVMRIQGQLDDGPAPANREFVPYENALSALEDLSEQVDSPLVPIIMSWEQPGPWVYPDSFPVAGGDESLRSFTTAARSRGWHVGTYCNGTQWVTGHKWTGYDGEDYYRAHLGAETVCRLPDGALWRNIWDRHWRSSYICCMAAPGTQDIAVGYVQHLLDLGLDWIQFLDQNCGAAAFPCYGEEHGHDPYPGGWMTESLGNLLAKFEELAEKKDREIIFSVEGAPNDHFIDHFQVCDIRPNVDPDSRFVPLYQYLFHEYILTQAAFAPGPNPYWMQIKTAHSFVFGDMLTAIMGPEGRLMNWAGHPWARWDTPSGNQEAILALLRRAIAMRRGPGRDFLMFGRLLRPYPVQDVEQITWITEQGLISMPAVMHANWRSPDGRTAVALANWTEQEQIVQMGTSSEGLGPRRYHMRGDAPRTVECARASWTPLFLPPLSVALVECGEVEDE